MRMFITALLLMPVLASGSETVTHTINADRVNIRTRAKTTSEVVTQVNQGDRVEVLRITEGWAEIEPPAGAAVWVHGDFVRDGKVQPKTLNVRSGAGINYHTVGSLSRGDSVTVLGTFGEWLKIQPSENTTFFVHTDFVERHTEVAAVEKPAEDPDDQPKPAVRPVPIRRPVRKPVRRPPEQDQGPARSGRAAEPEARAELMPAPKGLNLVPLEGQGRITTKEGELRAISFLERAPAKFRLVRPVGNDFEIICYVKGNVRQLKSFTGRPLRIKGGEFWVQGESVPVMVPSLIVPRRRP